MISSSLSPFSTLEKAFIIYTSGDVSYGDIAVISLAEAYEHGFDFKSAAVGALNAFNEREVG